MILAMNITAWSKRAPWAERRQVELDLIISHAIVELFMDAFLAEELRFRGGTASGRTFVDGMFKSPAPHLINVTLRESWLGRAQGRSDDEVGVA